MTSIAFRLAEIERRQANMLRLGTVAQLDTASARVRVQIGTLLTAWLPWLTQRAGARRTWDPPTVGEQVLVLSPGGDMGQGLALPAVYMLAFTPPSASPTKHREEFADGTVIEYDLAAHKLTATVAGSAEVMAVTEVKATAGVKVTLAAPVVEVTAPVINLTGAVNIAGAVAFAGALTVTGGDVVADGISLKTHKHGGVQSGGSMTGLPA